MIFTYKNIQSSTDDIAKTLKVLALAVIVSVNMIAAPLQADTPTTSHSPIQISTEYEDTTPGRPRPNPNSNDEDDIRKSKSDPTPNKPK